MKNLLSLCLIAGLFTGYSQNKESVKVGNQVSETEKMAESPKNSAEQLQGAQIQFEQTVKKFDDIKQGEVIEHEFPFLNTGSAPLILTDVKTTCGCTVPEWPRTPIAPGESSEIKVVFNSSGKRGIQNKVVTIMSNAINSPAQVTIKTNVILPDSGN